MPAAATVTAKAPVWPCVSANPPAGTRGAIRCGTWIGESDIILDLLTTEVETTEQIYFPLFLPDAVSLRQHPRFRQLVDESGLLEYWRQWGWSDYCRPDGDSFRCD